MLILSAVNLDNLTLNQYILGLIFYSLIMMAILSIIGFIIDQLKLYQQYNDDELQATTDIIKSSKDGLDSSICLFKIKSHKIDSFTADIYENLL